MLIHKTIALGNDATVSIKGSNNSTIIYIVKIAAVNGEPGG